MIHKTKLSEQPITVSFEKKGHTLYWKVDWASVKEEEAQALQNEAGYAIQGYGFDRFTGNRWQSQASCD